MKQNTDTLYTFVTGGAFASLAFLMGIVINFLKTVALLMIVDYWIGTAASVGDKTTSSKSAFKGLLKKASMLSLIFAGI
ncbi:phage holin family protein [Bacillus sp. SCS-151]|uniref:phage holin family protein n=1 Tax=Nanhaiella sioensis TaxID=3115293 RepID=UPI00397C0A44